MTRIETRPTAPRLQLSGAVRFAIAAAVAIVLALAWIGAGHASRQAVRTASAAISPASALVSQPRVETARAERPGVARQQRGRS